MHVAVYLYYSIYASNVNPAIFFHFCAFEGQIEFILFLSAQRTFLIFTPPSAQFTNSQRATCCSIFSLIVQHVFLRFINELTDLEEHLPPFTSELFLPRFLSINM